MKAQLRGQTIQVSFPYSASMVERIREVEGRKYDKNTRCWNLKLSLDSIQFIVDQGFEVSEQDLDRLSKLTEKLIDKEKARKLISKLTKSVHADLIDEVANKMLLPAYSYQWVPCHVSRLTDGRFLLADSMGIGKSLQSLMVVNLPEYKDTPVLIVSPVPYTYQAEIKKFFNEPSMVLEPGQRLKTLHPRCRYYITTQHRLKYLFQDEDRRIPYDCIKDVFVIFDECHLYKEPKAQRTKYARAISGFSKYAIGMTGTPIMNRVEEIYHVLCLIDKHFMTYTQFVKKFCNAHWSAYGYITSGYSNLQHLNTWLFDNIMVRREKSQVQSQMPEKIRQSIDLRDKPINISADSILGMYAESARQKSEDPEFLSWIETALDNCPKTGIFVHHKVMADAIEKICKDKGHKFIRIDGEDSDQQRRHQRVEEFRTNPDCRVAILSIGCASMGLNGLQVAQLCIFAELPWTPGLLEQGEDRFHRTGLAGDLLVMYPIFSNFDQVMIRLILSKLGIVRRATSINQIPDVISEESLFQALSKEFGVPVGGKRKK